MTLEVYKKYVGAFRVSVKVQITYQSTFKPTDNNVMLPSYLLCKLKIPYAQLSGTNGI
jgi:hypothetical protein